MLRIYDVALEMAGDAADFARVIALRDSDLARQLRRAATSVALNLAEGAGLWGGNRRQRYNTALGSAREVLACMQLGFAMGYCGGIEVEVKARLDRIIGTLVRICR